MEFKRNDKVIGKSGRVFTVTKDTDIDSSKFLIRRDLKAQRKLKIIDD